MAQTPPPTEARQALLQACNAGLRCRRMLRRRHQPDAVDDLVRCRGRSERVNRTLQDRLVKELHTAGIRTLERANRYLQECFLPAYNDEFARDPADPESGFAPLGAADLEAIFCHEETRTVQRDNTVTLESVRLQIAKQPGRATCAGLQVLARRHLDGTHTVWWGPKLLGRFSAQGRALSREPIVHATPAAHVAAVA